MAIVVGGMQIGRDGRVHTTLGHNPSTLRLSSFDPNMQNIPRTGTGVERYVKEIFVAPPGHTFVERDFSAIEAVLVGYFAGSARYVRFAKLGVHDYVLSHMVGRVPDLGLSDRDLKAAFKLLKAEFLKERDTAKRVVHGSNYQMSAKRCHELFPEYFPTLRSAQQLQDLYFGLFPEIRKWHRDICQRVDGTKKREAENESDASELGVCFARNPFGYVHRFYNVIQWRKVNVADGTTEWTWDFGEDSKRLVAFLPQSTAAAIIKKAAKQIWYSHPTLASYLRLLVHDSIIFEVPDGEVDECLRVSEAVMESPIEELPLDPEWNMGQYLTIQTEAKVGKSWGSMK